MTCNTNTFGAVLGNIMDAGVFCQALATKVFPIKSKSWTGNLEQGPIVCNYMLVQAIFQ